MTHGSPVGYYSRVHNLFLDGGSMGIRGTGFFLQGGDDSLREEEGIAGVKGAVWAGGGTGWVVGRD